MVKEDDLVINHDIAQIKTADGGDGLQLRRLWRIAKNAVYRVSFRQQLIRGDSRALMFLEVGG